MRFRISKKRIQVLTDAYCPEKGRGVTKILLTFRIDDREAAESAKALMTDVEVDKFEEWIKEKIV